MAKVVLDITWRDLKVGDILDEGIQVERIHFFPDAHPPYPMSFVQGHLRMITDARGVERPVWKHCVEHIVLDLDYPVRVLRDAP